MGESEKGFGAYGNLNDQPKNSIADLDHSKRPKRNKYAFACAILASMTSILLGYDTGVMSGAAPFIQEDFHLTDVQVEVLVGTINIYSLIGSAFAGRTSDWVGRRYTIVIAGAIFFAGSILMGFAGNYAFLMVGRLVAGIGVGYALMIAPVYTVEVAPASARGFLTSFPEVFINLGVLLGYVSNFAFSKLPLNVGWRWMLGVSGIPSVVLAIGVLAMPESPRWLVMKGRLAEAKRVLVKTSDSAEEADLRLADIKQAAGIPADFQEGDDLILKHKSDGTQVWRELIINPTPAVRHIFICAVGIHFFQQASGIDAVVLYSPRIFEEAGLKTSDQKLLATVAVGFFKALFILIATFLLDRVGRRVLLLSSVGGMVVSLLTLASALTVIEHSDGNATWAVGLSIAMVLSFVGSFSMGLGPIAWVYSSEIFPLRLRALGASIGVAVNRGMSGLIGVSFISLYKTVTIGGAFFLFAIVTIITWVFCYTMMPETRGHSLEETQELFGHYHKWRSAVTYMHLEKKEGEETDCCVDEHQPQHGTVGSV